MPAIEGRCLCGSISYTSTDEPILVGICHCTDCRRQSGTAFSINVGVPAGGLTITGTPKVYETMGTDRGEPARRHFCGDCGSPIISVLADADDIAFVKGGTLDDPSWIEPELELWEESRLPGVDRIESEERGYFSRGLNTD